jgi:hypothetical protein
MNIGIQAGWGEYLRDVAINANVVRAADIGIAVSVVHGAGTAVIADNLISGARMGAILGMEWTNPSVGRSRQGRRRPLRAIVDRWQPRAVTLRLRRRSEA